MFGLSLSSSTSSFPLLLPPPLLLPLPPPLCVSCCLCLHLDVRPLEAEGHVQPHRHVLRSFVRAQESIAKPPLAGKSGYSPHLKGTGLRWPTRMGRWA
jgi:hypothetical protein